MKILKEYFGNRLRQTMNGAGVKQSTLADKLKVQQSTVSRWINGHDLPDDTRLDEICKALNCKKEELFGFNANFQEPVNPEVQKLIQEIKSALNLKEVTLSRSDNQKTKYGSDGSGGYHLNPDEYAVIQAKLKDIDSYYPFYDIINAIRRSNLQKRNKIRSLLNLPILENEPKLEIEASFRKKIVK